MVFDQEWKDQQILNEAHQRWARRKGETKVLEWRLTRATEQRYQELLILMDDYPDGSDEALAIEGDIRSLPGFPAEAGPNTFTRRILTDVQH